MRAPIVLTLAAALISGAARADIPNVVGRASIASASLDYEMQAAALAPDGQTLWLTASSRPKGTVTGPESLLIASVDARNAVTQSPLSADVFESKSADPATRTQRRGLIDAMAFDSRGDLLLAGGRAANALVVARVQSNASRVEAPKALAAATASFDLQRVVRLRDGRALALGMAVDKLASAELGENGRLSPPKTIATNAAFVETAESAFDGGAVLLARRGLEVATAEVLVAKLSPRGDLEKTATLPGRTGSVAALKGGGYALVSSRAGARGFDLSLRMLDAEMHERSATPLVTDQVNPAFAVIATRGGGFVVAGSKDHGLWVSEYDADGKALWTEARVPAPPEAEMVFNLRLLTAGDTVFLPYTAFTIENREQRKSIRVLKFQAK